MPPRKSSVAMHRLRPPAQRHTDPPLPWAAPADRPADRGVDLSRIEHAIREIIIALGEDPDREGLRQTPARIARAYAELTRGLRIDPRAYLKTSFGCGCAATRLLRDITPPDRARNSASGVSE